MPKKGYKATEEHRNKNSEARKKMWNNLEFRKKVAIIYQNSIPRKKAIEKLKIISKGKHYSPKTEFKKGLIPANFKGRINHSFGYVLIYSPHHPFCGVRKNVFEHRLMVEKQIGRYLDPKEMVHHINGIKHDNRPQNLMAFKTRRFHVKFEFGKYINPKYIIFDGRQITPSFENKSLQND